MKGASRESPVLLQDREVARMEAVDQGKSPGEPTHAACAVDLVERWTVSRCVVLAAHLGLQEAPGWGAGV